MANANNLIAGVHTVTKGPRGKEWLATSAIDMAAIPQDIVARLAIHGLQQKIADAASGAETEAEAKGAMDKAIAAILAGDWSSRGAAAGVDEFTTIARQVVRGALKDKLGAKSAEWAEFTGRSDADQAKALDANFAKNEAIFRPIVEAKVEERAADRARKAKAAKAVTFEI